MSFAPPQSWFWAPPGQPAKPHSRVTIYLLGHAGGTAADFRRWDSFASDSSQLVAVALPGRPPNRTSEPPSTDLNSLVWGVANAISRVNGDSRPWAIFGQSFGAVLAYEIAARATQGEFRGLSAPEFLIVCARRAAHLPDPFEGERFISRSSGDEELVGMLAERYHDENLGKVMRVSPEFLRPFIPQMRADITAFDGYRKSRYLPGLDVERKCRPLRCPVLVVAGKDDDRLPNEEEDCRGWLRHTSAECPEPIRYEGGHFFTRSDEAAKTLVRDVERLVLQHLDKRGVAAKPVSPQQQQETPEDDDLLGCF